MLYSIVLVNLILYWRTLLYFFVVDDMSLVPAKETKLSVWKQIWDEIASKHLHNAPRCHAVMIFTHTLVCCCIYLCFGSNMQSFLAALLFSVNPSNNAGAIWISGKPYTHGALVGMAIYAFPKIAWLFWFLAIGIGKAHMVFALPLMYLGTSYWYYAAMLPFFFMFNKCYSGIGHKMDNKGVSQEMITFNPKKFIIAIKTFAYYLRLSLTGGPLCIHHNFLYGYALQKKYTKKWYRLDKYFYAGCVFIALFIVAFIYVPPMRVGLAWFVLTILPFCNFLTIQEYVAERYLYVPNVGLMLAMAGLTTVIPHGLYICLTYMVFYGTRTWFWMPSYKNIFFMVEYNIMEQWDNVRARMTRARFKYRQGEILGAFFEYQIALTAVPYDYKLNFNTSVIAMLLNQPKEAQKRLNIAKRHPYTNRFTEDIKAQIKNQQELINKAVAGEPVEMSKINLLAP